MFGFAFERVMETLLTERGYKIIKADELGYEPDEMLAIAKEYNPAGYANTSKYFEGAESSMSCKDILDHFFKLDCLLELPRKKGEPQVVVGLQFYNYHEGDLDFEKRIKSKVRQLEQSWEACQELFIARTYVIAGYVPRSWDGLGLRTDDQNQLIKQRVLQVITELAKPHESPQAVHISFDF